MEAKVTKESLFSAKQIVAMGVGTALYAALTIPLNALQLPGYGLIAIRPTVAIPMLFGFVFGPIAGFVSGCLGNIFSDAFSWGGFWPVWDIGNGLMGAIPGIAYFVIKRTDWSKARGLTTAAVLAVVGSGIGMGFAALIDYIFQIGISTFDAAFSFPLGEFWGAFIPDAINGLILTPILLYAYAASTAGRARRV
jgi:energy-coupling factor transport system substrate-specific component